MKSLKEFKTGRVPKHFKAVFTKELDCFDGDLVDCIDIYKEGELLGTLDTQFIFVYDDGNYTDSFYSKDWNEFTKQLKGIYNVTT